MSIFIKIFIQRKLFLVLFLFLCLINRSAQANVYTVSNISVDVTDETSARSKEIAYLKVISYAFRHTVANLAFEPYNIILPPINALNIDEMVASFQIHNEKFSDTRYWATISVTFNPNAVHKNLNEYIKIDYSPHKRPNILIIPTFRVLGEQTQIFQNNPWKEKWLTKEPPPLNPFKLFNYVAIEENTLKTGLTPLNLIHLAKLHQIPHIATVHAEVDSPIKPQKIKITIDSYHSQYNPYKKKFLESNTFTSQETKSFIIQAMQDETLDSLLNRTIEFLPAYFFSSQALSQYGKLNFKQKTIFIVKYDSWTEWKDIQARLEKSNVFSKIEKQFINVKFSQINASHTDSIETIKTTLKKYKLILQYAPDQNTDVWQITLQ